MRGEVETGGDAALGNLTKSASTSSQTQGAKRLQRWRLHEAVGDLLPGSRAALCGHRAVPNRSPALRVDPKGHGYYAGVRACGSVWHCPFCAAKVGRARVIELRRAVAAAEAKGYTVTLATFTLGHKATDGLGRLLTELTEAMRYWRSGRWWVGYEGKRKVTVGMRDELGYVGSVRNLEVTWGQGSGWHPHSHALLITRWPISEKNAAALQARWVQSVERQGGYASESVGLKLSDHDGDVAGYLDKAERDLMEATGEYIEATDERRGWGAAEELVWAHVKETRAGQRFTPWALLRTLVETGWADAADRWVEYAAAFHGKRQLYWSQGLRDALDLGAEVTDEELAEAEGEADETVTVFTDSEWKRLVREGQRAELLRVTTLEGVEAARLWLLTWRYGSGELVDFNPDWWDGDPGAWTDGEASL